MNFDNPRSTLNFKLQVEKTFPLEGALPPESLVRVAVCLQNIALYIKLRSMPPYFSLKMFFWILTFFTCKQINVFCILALLKSGLCSRNKIELDQHVQRFLIQVALGIILHYLLTALILILTCSAKWTHRVGSLFNTAFSRDKSSMVGVWTNKFV